MSFTVLYALFALLLLVVIFGLTYKIKGLKIALITTAAAFIILAVTLVVMISAILSVMSN